MILCWLHVILVALDTTLDTTLDTAHTYPARDTRYGPGYERMCGQPKLQEQPLIPKRTSSSPIYQIKHVIYLTLENHSFDSIAGSWDLHPDIDSLRTSHSATTIQAYKPKLDSLWRTTRYLRRAIRNGSAIEGSRSQLRLSLTLDFYD